MLLNAHLTELRGASSAGAAASAVRVIVRIVVAPPAPRCLSLSILLPLLLLLAVLKAAGIQKLVSKAEDGAPLRPLAH